MVIATDKFMSQGVNMLFTNASRREVKSRMRGIYCWMRISERPTARFYTLGGMAITPDNTIMALAEDYLSRRQYGLRFRNLESGNWYPELLDNVAPEFVWANDSLTLYYVRKHGTKLLPYQVWRHTRGYAGHAGSTGL
ncbi:protease 2 [Citrobacter koseri]|uniref:Protease 2 n=1 Tax=Citrobacter koseri TaxID=545 RepID=A0A2X2VS51_CITKO|nr:protease 2 [Citrobacter koseri]